MSVKAVLSFVKARRTLFVASLATALFTPSANAEVSAGMSRDLDAYRAPYDSSAPQGYSLCDIVGIGIAGSNDHVYVWYRNGMVSSGSTSDLARYRSPQPYSMPQGRSPADIVAMAVAGSNDWVYTWYRDGSMSAGSSTDLASHRPPRPYSLPPGKTPQSVVGIGIAGSNDRVFVWYDNGTVSSGTSTDLDDATPPQAVNNAQGFTTPQIIDIAIAGSNDHVYTWYGNCALPGGVVAKTQPQVGQPSPKETSKPHFDVIPDAVIVPQAGQSGPAKPDLTLIPKALEALRKPQFQIIPDAVIAPEAQQAEKKPTFEIIPDAAITKPSARQIDVSQWKNRLADITQSGLSVLNDSMDQLDALTGQSATLRIKEAPGGLRPPILDGPDLIDNLQKNKALAISEEFLASAAPGLGQAKPDMNAVSAKPQVTDLLVFPEAEALQPGGYVVIKGTGFGDEAGRVFMRYESGSGELTESRLSHDVELEPVNDSWAAAWHDTVIVVRVPDDLPGQMLGGARNAELALVKPNGAQIKLSVLLHASSAPVIASVTSSGGEIGCCCPIGTETWSRLPESHNYVFWPAPGRLDTPHCGLDKKPWLQPGSKIVIAGKRFGEILNGKLPGTLALEFPDESRPAGISVKLDVTKWSSTSIEARVVSSPIKGYFATHPAWINLHVGDDYANAEPVAFGPEMSYKWVSGNKWLKLDWDSLGEKIETPNGKAMLVTHVPDCGTFDDDGEKGYDQFFDDTAHAYPDDAQVTWFRFEQIDPTHPVDEWDVFGIGVDDLASVILDPSSLIRLGAELLIKAFTLAGEGGYHAYPFFFGNQGVLMGPENSFSIRWETSCEIGDGKPIVYTTSFLLEGPPAALAKY